MARTLIFWKRNGNLQKPSKVWQGIQSLAIQILGFSLWPQWVTFKNLTGSLIEPPKLWRGIQSLAMRIFGFSLWTQG